MAKAKTKSIYEKYLPALPDRDVYIPNKSNGGRVVQAFVYADLRLMLPGLLKIMRGHGIYPENLKPGMCVPFVNTERNYLKVIVGNGSPFPVLACYRMPPGERLPLEGVADVYQAFQALASPLSAEERLRAALEKYASTSRRERLTVRQLRDVTPREQA
jgi:hypothetical protein